MSILQPFRICAAAAALGCALSAGPLRAQTPDATITVRPGVRAQISYSIHFNLKTCQAMSVPTITVIRQPSKGTAEVVRETAPLQSVQNEKGKACIGTPMRAAVVYYTARAGESGPDFFTYRVVFPRSCTNCTNFTRTVTLAITPPSTPQAPREGGPPPTGEASGAGARSP